MQWTLIIPGFCICSFAYSLKVICNPRINTRGTSAGFRECTYRAVRNANHNPSGKQAGTKGGPDFVFHAGSKNSVHVVVSSVPCVSHFCAFCW